MYFRALTIIAFILGISLFEVRPAFAVIGAVCHSQEAPCGTGETCVGDTATEYGTCQAATSVAPTQSCSPSIPCEQSGYVCNQSSGFCEPSAPAQTPPPTTTQTPGSTTKLLNPLGGVDTIQGAIGNIISLIIGLVGTGALLMFVWGGVRFILARGNEKEISAAKGIITWSVFGIAVVFLAYAIVNALVQAFSSTGA